MAVVGHAYVVVRAITDKVEKDIRKGFEGTSATAHRAGTDLGNAMTRGLSKSFKNNNSFTRLSDQIKTMYPEAEHAATSFTKLVRKGYVVQSGMGALLGSIGALVGGLGALVGIAGGAAGSIVALGGAFLTLKVGMSVASFALKGVMQAVSAATKANGGYSKSLKEIQFDAEDAALNVDKAGIALEKAIEARNRVADLAPNNRIRREADLAVRQAELALRKAKYAEENPDKGGGSDPYAGLTPAQKQFAQFLAGLKPKFDELRESAAKGFLPLLEQQMTRLINNGLLDTLRDRFYDIGQGLGVATEKFVDVFLTGNGLNNLNVILGQIARNLPPLGSTLGNLFTTFLTTIRAADPITRRFIGFLETKTSTFSKFLETKRMSGELQVFFRMAGDLAARFGNVFGNTFGGLGKIIQANFGPGSGGDVLLQWLQDVTAGWKNMDLIGIQNYFKGAADNFVAMGNALGGALEIIIKAGSNPAIKEFYDIMDGASYAFQQIVSGSVGAAPALADILVKLTEIIAVFADSGSVKAFFGTISYFLGGIMEVLKALKPLIDGLLGPIFAVVSAFGFMFAIVTKIGLIGSGMIGKLLFSLGQIPMLAGLANTKLALTAVAANAAGAATMTAMAPVLPLVLAIGAAIAIVAAAFGIHAANMEKATKGVTKGFEEGANATKIWQQATLSSAGPFKAQATNIANISKNVNALGKAQKEGFGPRTTVTTTAMADSFGAMGRALANIATTNLPKAQSQMKKFATETKLSNAQVAIAIDEMDEYKKTLVDQATQMGINIGDTNTLAGKLRLAQFAMGDGEVATRRMEQAQKDFAAKVAEAARSMIDFESALKSATTNGVVNVEKLTKTTQKQFEEAAAFQNNIFTLQAQGYDGLAQQFLDAGAGFSKELAGTVTKNKKILDKLEKDAVRTFFLASEEYKTAVETAGVLLPLAMSKLGKSTIDAFQKAFANATTEAELTRALSGLKTSLINAGVKLPVSIEYDSVDTKNVIKKISGDLKAGKTTLWPKKKDGGFIRGFADGSGGPVFGAGTARSDSIPAMLSNGEYVVNARATAQNRELLDAINSNQSVGMGNSVQVIVNPSAKMDEKELAAEVSRQIAFSIRKGGY